LTTSNDLDRAVVLHLCADGTLAREALYGPPPTGHTHDWRDIAIDALIDGRLKDAAHLISENFTEPLRDQPERACYSLPVFSVDTRMHAQLLQARFCRLMNTKHPFDTLRAPWYVWTNFGGTIEDLVVVSDTLHAAYAAILAKESRG
jgi:hypothetical protein